MDFNIQLAAKNEITGFLNIIIPAVFGIGGVLIGFLMNGWRERQKQKQEIQNIRSMIYMELSFVKENIENLEKVIKDPVTLALALTNVTTQKPVYDAYIGQINRLEEEEARKIYTAYWQLVMMNTECQTVKGQLDRKELLTVVDAIMLQISTGAWKSKISEALEEIERHRRRKGKGGNQTHRGG